MLVVWLVWQTLVLVPVHLLGITEHLTATKLAFASAALSAATLGVVWALEGRAFGGEQMQHPHKGLLGLGHHYRGRQRQGINRLGDERRRGV